MLSKSVTNSKRKKGPQTSGASLNKKMKNYADDPTFVKKADRAKEIIDKYGFPKDLSQKK